MKKSIFIIALISLFALPMAAQDKVFGAPTTECKLAAPNAFTPNADGVNDNFRLVLTGDCGYTRYEFKVYDRWGRIVFETNDPTQEWDGTYDGQSLKEGVYLWQGAVLWSSDKSETKKGSVMLIR